MPEFTLFGRLCPFFPCQAFPTKMPRPESVAFLFDFSSSAITHCCCFGSMDFDGGDH